MYNLFNKRPKNVERIFMIGNLNEKQDIILFAVISVLLLYLSTFSLVFSLSLPILLAIKLGEFDKKSALVFILIVGILSLILDIRLTLIIFLPLALYSILMVYLIRKNFDDKNSILILTSILSIFIFILLGIGYKIGYIKFDIMVDELIKVFERQGVTIGKDLVKESFRIIPAMCVILNLIYTIISLKLVRNYLSFKDDTIRDLESIGNLRLDIKIIPSLAILFIIGAIIAKIFGLDNLTIMKNTISVLISLLQINALLLIDFLLKKRSKVHRLVNWVLIFILFTFLKEILAIIGFIDIIVNIREKVRL